MIVSRLLLASLPALCLAASALAQQPDRARLDDFAVPTGEAELGVQQIVDQNQAVAEQSPPRDDRQLTVPGPPPQAHRPIAQLSAGGDVESATQLSGRSDSTSSAPEGISSRQDSRPRAVAALTGTDRCDPQQPAEQLAKCQRILELRAAEFNATEPPKLSAEQVLLVERGESYEVLATTDAGLRLKLAGGSGPSAEIRANQEIASIYLDPPPAPQEAIMAAEQTPAEGITELIQGLLGLQPPTGN